MFRHYSPRSRFSASCLDLPTISTGRVHNNFLTRVGSGFDLSTPHGGSGYDSFSDKESGLYYLPPPWHVGSGFDASLHGGSGYDVDMGEAIGYDDPVCDRGFALVPTRHGCGGHAFDEQGSCFDGNLGDNHPPTRHGHGGSSFVATHFGGGSGNDRGSNYTSTWHRRGGSGFAPAWRGHSGLSGFNGHADDPWIQYPTYQPGGRDFFDVPWRYPFSCRSGLFHLLDAAECQRGSLRLPSAPYPTGYWQ
jgi:hypothetical protein